MRYFIDGLKNYVNFGERATRKQFWFFILCYMIIIITTTIIDLLIGTLGFFGDTGLITGVFGLATILPFLAITVRRLHDIGKSGFWYFISLVPIIGPLYLLYLLCKSSNPEANDYGPPVNYVNQA